MENVKAHFEEEASYFDQLIPKLIPHYEEMLSALVLSIPFDTSASFKIIDLGCGTGTVSKKIKATFPDAHITCLDFSENMLETAQKKLSGFSNIDFVKADFSKSAFPCAYDAAVSSLALHHFPSDTDKKTFYKKVFDALNDKGIFYNADVVLGSNDHFQTRYMEKWKSFMRLSISDKEIETKWMPKHKEEDRPAPLMDQLSWLIDIGFQSVDVVWKYYNFAVYGGIKPVISV